MSAQSRDLEMLITPPSGLDSIDFKELWAYRELLGFMVWRDVSVRYKQSILGILWALLTPLTTMVIFTIIFGKVAKIPTDGIPYPIFSYAGLLPWLFFSQSFQRATLSMVAERNLLTKIYFPRLIVPMAATLAPLVDLLIASSVLFVMMFYYQMAPTLHCVYLLPLLVLWAWVTAVGVGLWLSALNVYFRDVGQLTPFLVQVWMFASPVVYPASLVPPGFQWLYALNPMTGVIEGFRWALLAHGDPPGLIVLVSAAVSLVLFVTGGIFFKRMERSFADVV
ncbi:MAG: ABC transporter permease [Myxococcales bacterium]|nr:ABC transporter permease [Myxococcales bacterium]